MTINMNKDLFPDYRFWKLPNFQLLYAVSIDDDVLVRIKLEQALKLTPLFKGDERKRSQDQLVVNVFQRLFQTRLPLLSFNF